MADGGCETTVARCTGRRRPYKYGSWGVYSRLRNLIRRSTSSKPRLPCARREPSFSISVSEASSVYPRSRDHELGGRHQRSADAAMPRGFLDEPAFDVWNRHRIAAVRKSADGEFEKTDRVRRAVLGNKHGVDDAAAGSVDERIHFVGQRERVFVFPQTAAHRRPSGGVAFLDAGRITLGLGALKAYSAGARVRADSAPTIPSAKSKRRRTARRR